MHVLTLASRDNLWDETLWIFTILILERDANTGASCAEKSSLGKSATELINYTDVMSRCSHVSLSKSLVLNEKFKITLDVLTWYWYMGLCPPAEYKFRTFLWPFCFPAYKQSLPKISFKDFCLYYNNKYGICIDIYTYIQQFILNDILDLQLSFVVTLPSPVNLLRMSCSIITT